MFVNQPSLRYAVTTGLLSVLSASPTLATAQSAIDVSGSLGVELRGFVQDPSFDGQLRGIQSSVTAEVDFDWESEDRRHQITVTPFGRLDAEDDERTHGDLREAFWRYIGDEWEVLLGVNRVFWGVTESRHLVNIINQIDAVEDTDEEDFLGQPMINIGNQQDFGRFDLFVLPYFRERTFGGVDARLRPPLPVDESEARYESDAEETHIDTALRYSHNIGDWDIGLSLFHGTSREPVLQPNSTGTRLVPLYNIITQGGVDLQYTRDAWLWKLEAITRNGQGDRFEATVAGLEYTLFQIAESDVDLGLLVEYLYDGRDEIDAPATVLDDDLFLGTRLTLNDTQDTAVLFGGIIDLHDQSAGFRLEAERRLGDSWKLELEGQAFTNVDDDNLSAAFRNDDFVTLRLTRFF